MGNLSANFIEIIQVHLVSVSHFTRVSFVSQSLATPNIILFSGS